MKISLLNFSRGIFLKKFTGSACNNYTSMVVYRCKKKVNIKLLINCLNILLFITI